MPSNLSDITQKYKQEHNMSFSTLRQNSYMTYTLYHKTYNIIRLTVFLLCSIFASSKPPEHILSQSTLINESRRILRGNVIVDTRPYMVYLRPAQHDQQLKDPNWLCGGAIIDAQYILTSAACIEDVKQFYVVSGTHRWIPPGTDDDCITNGAKRAVWKCVPKNYAFDGDQVDNIRWMINDIAVVKVEDDFNFERRVRGCDFIPKMIGYNNVSEDLERAGTVGSIAGWGSVDQFGNEFGRATVNSPNLQETDVVLVSKRNCKKRWPERYHYIIDESMICAKDGVDSDSISKICIEQEVNCKELVYSEEDETYISRRFVIDPNRLQLHTAAHDDESRRAGGQTSGGFCENDHGGPLVVGHGPTARIIGVISACLTANITQKCYGPFLYTSVWKNRHLISCAIEKEKGTTCRKYLKAKNKQISETTFDWSSHTDSITRPRLRVDIFEDSITDQPKKEKTLTTRVSRTRSSFKYKG